MQPHATRRDALRAQAASLVALATAPALAPHARAVPRSLQPQPDPSAPHRWPGFPQQDPALVREIVGASHGNIERVKELLAAHPALAKANYDWGFGDWESALGAASHVGHTEIAALLLEHGARLDIFAAAMLGMVDVVRAALTAQPALARTRGPHGIPLLAHAVVGKNQSMIEYLKSVDGSDDTPTQPITPDEMKTYLGVYEQRGPDARTVHVTETRFGMAVKPEGGIDRTLVRTGAHTFHPAGAPNVRVVFEVADGTARRVEIVEDTWYVSAQRR